MITLFLQCFWSAALLYVWMGMSAYLTALLVQERRDAGQGTGSVLKAKTFLCTLTWPYHAIVMVFKRPE